MSLDPLREKNSKEPRGSFFVRSSSVERGIVQRGSVNGHAREPKSTMGVYGFSSTWGAFVRTTGVAQLNARRSILERHKKV